MNDQDFFAKLVEWLRALWEAFLLWLAQVLGLG